MPSLNSFVLRHTLTLVILICGLTFPVPSLFAQTPFPIELGIMDRSIGPITMDGVSGSLPLGDGYLITTQNYFADRGGLHYFDGTDITHILPGALIEPGILGTLNEHVLLSLSRVEGDLHLVTIDSITFDTTRLLELRGTKPPEVFPFGDRMFLYSPEFGLVVTDGTEANTELLHVSFGSLLREKSTPFGNGHLFALWDELLFTDGTMEGTVTLGTDIDFRDEGMLVDGEELFFVSGNSLYRSDGTIAGTEVLIESDFTAIFGLGVTDNGLVFLGDRPANGIEAYRYVEEEQRYELAFKSVDDNEEEDGINRRAQRGFYSPRSIDLSGYYLTTTRANEFIISKGTPETTTGTIIFGDNLSTGGYSFVAPDTTVNGSHYIVVMDDDDSALYQFDLRGADPELSFIANFQSQFSVPTQRVNPVSNFGDYLVFGSQPVHLYNTVTNQLTVLPDLPGLRDRQPMLASGGFLYVIGYDQNVPNDYYRFELSEDTDMERVGGLVPDTVLYALHILGNYNEEVLVSGRDTTRNLGLFSLTADGRSRKIAEFPQLANRDSRVGQLFSSIGRLVNVYGDDVYTSTGVTGTLERLRLNDRQIDYRTQTEEHFLALTNTPSAGYLTSDGTAAGTTFRERRAGTAGVTSAQGKFLLYEYPERRNGELSGVFHLSLIEPTSGLIEEEATAFGFDVIGRASFPNPSVVTFSPEPERTDVYVGWPAGVRVGLAKFDFDSGELATDPDIVIAEDKNIYSLTSDGRFLAATLAGDNNDFTLLVYDMETEETVYREETTQRYPIMDISAATTRPVILTNRRLLALQNGTLEELHLFTDNFTRLTSLTEVGDGRTYFADVFGNGGLWVTDGTSGGTRQISAVRPSSEVDPVLLNGNYIFMAPSLIDGTDRFHFVDTETDIVTELPLPTVLPSSIGELTPYRERLYFTGSHDTYGVEIMYLDFGLTSGGGLIYEDVNTNGQHDAGESGIPGVRVNLNSEGDGLYTTFSRADGRYEIRPHSEFAYQVTIQPDDCWVSLATPDDYTVSAGERPTDLNFGLTRASDQGSLRASLISATIRCGFTLPFWLNVTNDGCQNLDTRTELNLGELVSYVSAIPEPTSIEGSVLHWELGELAVGESTQIELTLTLPGEEFDGEVIPMTLTASGFDDAMEHVATDTFAYNDQLRCAIDPNDKQVHPNRPEATNSNYTQFDEELLYTVRFQNTGSDTAFNVRIEDQLSDRLDWASVKPLAASHPYRMELSETGLLSVHFDQILLVDSTTNEPGSLGFVTFTVRLRDDIGELETVSNTAGIFFDFNRPVITNTVASTAVEFLDRDEDGFFFWTECDDTDPDIFPGAPETDGDGVDSNCDGEDGTVSVREPLPGTLQLYPNPTDGTLQLTYDQAILLQVDVFDGRGRRMQSFSLNRTATTDLSRLPAGLYLLRLADVRSGRVSTRRVVRR